MTVALAARASGQWNFLKRLPFRPEQIEMDERGSLYVLGPIGQPVTLLGTTYSAQKKTDWLLVKYTEALVPLWVRRIRSDSATDMGKLRYVRNLGLVLAGLNRAALDVAGTTIAYTANPHPVDQGAQDPFLAALDTAGAVAFAKAVFVSTEQNRNDQVPALSLNAQGTLFALFQGSYANSAMAWIARVGSGGSLLDSLNVTPGPAIGSMSFIQDFAVAPDGGYALAGGYQSFSPRVQMPQVVRLDSAGALRWSKTLPLLGSAPNYVSYWARRIMARPDTSFVITTAQGYNTGEVGYVFNDTGGYRLPYPFWDGFQFPTLQNYVDTSYFIVGAESFQTSFNVEKNHVYLYGSPQSKRFVTGTGFNFSTFGFGYPLDMAWNGGGRVYMSGFYSKAFTLDGLGLQDSMGYYLAQYGPCTIQGASVAESNGVLTAQPASKKYQWYMDGVYSCGDTAQSLPVDRVGRYQVYIKDGDCRNLTAPLQTAPSGANRPEWLWTLATGRPTGGGPDCSYLDLLPQEYQCLAGEGSGASRNNPVSQTILRSVITPDGYAFSLLNAYDTARLGSIRVAGGQFLVKTSRLGQPLWARQVARPNASFGDTSTNFNDMALWNGMLVFGGSIEYDSAFSNSTAPILVFADTAGHPLDTVGNRVRFNRPGFISQLATAPNGDLVATGSGYAGVGIGTGVLQGTGMFVARFRARTGQMYQFAAAYAGPDTVRILGPRYMNVGTELSGNFPGESRGSLAVLPNGSVLMRIAVSGGRFSFGALRATGTGSFFQNDFYPSSSSVNALLDSNGNWVYVADSTATPVAALADNSFLAGGKRVQYGTWTESPIDANLGRAEFLFNAPGYGVLAVRNATFRNRNMHVALYNPDLSLQWNQGITGCGQTVTSVAFNPIDSTLTLAGSANSVQMFSLSLQTASGMAFLAKAGFNPPTGLATLRNMPARLLAWPNPATGEVQILSSEPVTLLALDGRAIATARPVQGRVRFNLKPLPGGAYLLRSADGRVGRVIKN